MTTRRHPGIVERHSKSCPTRDGGRCVKPCQPRFEAWVWSARDGRKVRKSFPTPAAARGWRTDALAALRRGTMRAPTSTTLNAAAAAFVAGIESGVIVSRNGSPYKPSVRRAYARDLRLFVLPEVGAVKLAELRRADMQALVDRLHAAGMSPTRLKGIVMPVRALCRHALERDELVVNPTEHLRLPAVTGKRERAASPAEAERLLSALADDDRALWATAFYAGLRRGELRALRWSDIDLTENVISVERSWDDVEGAIDPKSEKGRRRVPIATPLRLLLLEHKARTGRRAGEFVFGSTSTRPFTSTNIRRRARMAWAATAIGEFFCGRDAQLEPIGLHECRHTYVSLMAAAGFALEEIGDYVGHSSTYMVDRYRHLIEGHEARAQRRASMPTSPPEPCNSSVMAIPVRAVLWEPRMASLPMSDHEWQMYAVPAAGEHYWHDRTGYTVKEIEEVDGETRVHLIRDPAWEEEMATGLADDQSIVGGRQSETGEWHFDVVDKAGHRRGWSFGNDLELTIRDAVGNTQNP